MNCSDNFWSMRMKIVRKMKKRSSRKYRKCNRNMKMSYRSAPYVLTRLERTRLWLFSRIVTTSFAEIVFNNMLRMLSMRVRFPSFAQIHSAKQWWIKPTLKAFSTVFLISTSVETDRCNIMEKLTAMCIGARRPTVHSCLYSSKVIIRNYFVNYAGMNIVSNAGARGMRVWTVKSQESITITDKLIGNLSNLL